jgi:hypothetical protein
MRSRRRRRRRRRRKCRSSCEYRREAPPPREHARDPCRYSGVLARRRRSLRCFLRSVHSY